MPYIYNYYPWFIISLEAIWVLRTNWFLLRSSQYLSLICSWTKCFNRLNYEIILIFLPYNGIDLKKWTENLIDLILEHLGRKIQLKMGFTSLFQIKHNLSNNYCVGWLFDEGFCLPKSIDKSTLVKLKCFVM